MGMADPGAGTVPVDERRGEHRACKDRRKGAEMAESERKLGGIATRVLLENDRVKIWEMDLAPGEESDIHEHTMDYILVVLEGDKIAGVPQEDSAGLYNEYVEVDVSPGEYFWIEKGGIETARNIGKKRYREIAIELKD
jgi:hypothetical protein